MLQGMRRMNLIRRRRPTAAAFLFPLLGFSLPVAAEQALTVVSFGGSYARACQQAYHEPFTAATGIEVRLEDYNGGLAQIRAQVETGNVHWDVVDLNVADAVLGCGEISYGPVRRSGTALVGTHLETGVDMVPHMPTTPANLTRALHHDWRWWSDRGDEMTERFVAWLAR